MDKKLQRDIGALAGLGTGLAVLVVAVVFNLIPNNKYAGVFWMCFLPLVVFYSQEKTDKKDLINIWCSFVVGLIWGYIGVIITPPLQAMGTWAFIIVEFFIIEVLILYVHKGLLGHTILNRVSSVFLGFALSIAASTSYFWSGKLSATFQLLPMEQNFTQIDLFIIFTIGCVVCLINEVACNLIIGNYMKKRNSSATPK